jgi:molecular chaperone DnaJ
MKDYYKILGVDKNSSQDEIKKAYRKIAMKYHPDRNPNNKQAESMFKEAAEAYEILSNPEKKSNYDRFGQTGDFSNGFAYDVNDIFSQFGNIFGSFNNRYSNKRRGSDLRVKVSLSISEIINGVNKKIKYKRQNTCKPCNGMGGADIINCQSCQGTGRKVHVQNTPFGQIRHEVDCRDCMSSGKSIKNKCGACYGDGTSVMEEIVDIDIPPGVINGMQLNMSGYGNHVRDGIPGDLVIIVEEIEEFYFKRQDNNIIVEKEISVIDAIIGCNAKVKTPHGDIPITIEPGTEHGRKITIFSKGIPHHKFGVGDLHIIVKVKIPKSVNLEEKMILEKLKKSVSFS